MSKSNELGKETGLRSPTLCLKFNALSSIVFEYIYKLSEFNQRKFNLDEDQIRKLNSILSNIPFDVIKQEYERLNFEVSKL